MALRASQKLASAAALTSLSHLIRLSEIVTNSAGIQNRTRGFPFIRLLCALVLVMYPLNRYIVCGFGVMAMPMKKLEFLIFILSAL